MADEIPEPEYDLLMPFVPVKSRGGPHDDDAYVAGYEMGLLNAALEAMPSYHRAVLRTDNREQADLIAMRHEYIAVLKEAGEGWLHAEFRPALADLEADHG